MSARDNFDIYTNEDSTKSTNIHQIQPFNIQEFEENVIDIEHSWVREDVEGMEVDSINQGDNNSEMDEEE